MLYLYFGFEATMNINFFFELLLGLLYVLFNCGLNIKNKDKKLKETIARLKEIGENRQKKLDKDESIGEIMESDLA